MVNIYDHVTHASITNGLWAQAFGILLFRKIGGEARGIAEIFGEEVRLASSRLCLGPISLPNYCHPCSCQQGDVAVTRYGVRVVATAAPFNTVTGGIDAAAFTGCMS